MARGTATATAGACTATATRSGATPTMTIRGEALALREPVWHIAQLGVCRNLHDASRSSPCS